jgi:hypothetical protein
MRICDKDRELRQAKEVERLEPKGTGRRECRLANAASRTNLPGREQAPNPTDFGKRNVETPYSSRGVFANGKANRKASRWECGLEKSEKAKAVL